MASPRGKVRRARVGIDDVAAAAGVSRQTVSNVLNKRGRFSAPTRERVVAEVTRLGYLPHRGARSLRSRRSMQLALPLSPGLLRPGNVIMAQFLQACIAAAAERDQHVLVSVGSDVDGIHQLIATASVDAFLLADTGSDDPRVAVLAAAGVPFGCFGRTRPDQPQSWVDLDNVGAVSGVVAHLLALGHRHLSYIGFDGPDFWNVEREQGFLRGLQAGGLPARSHAIRRADRASARAVIERLLQRNRPTAVVTGSDALAAVVYAVAASRGLHVGRDLTVTGVDGGALGGALIPSLTTVAIPMATIARAVVDRALAEVDGPTGRPGLVVQGDLVVGGSSGPPHPARPGRP